MTTPSNQDATPAAGSLDAVIAGYLQAIESGEVPNRQDWLDRHAEMAEALRSFFADLDRMDRIGSPLRIEDDPTQDHSAESPQAMPQTIRYFGDYELLEEVARGGMGIVYRARQTSLNRIVALKTVLQGVFAAAGLLMATIMSIAFALQWQKRAKAEGERSLVAETAKSEANQARDKMQGLLARGIVQSFNLNISEWVDSLMQPERETLWQLARSEEPGLGFRLYRECTVDPILAESLLARCEPAAIAAFGLDESKRHLVSNEIVQALQTPTDAQKRRSCWLKR